jgi:hypothetical protein
MTTAAYSLMTHVGETENRDESNILKGLTLQIVGLGEGGDDKILDGAGKVQVKLVILLFRGEFLPHNTRLESRTCHQCLRL